MADSTYKLTYFKAPGTAECVRFMFAYADVEYEDYRIGHHEWIQIKDQQPFGTLPVLEIDGNQLAQSTSICRYLGKRFGLEAEDPLLNARLETVVDTVRDLQAKMTPLLKEGSLEEAEKLFNDKMPKLEPLADEGYFYRSEPTWVDVHFTSMIDSLAKYLPNCLDEYPNLSALCENIKSKESLAKYLEDRPV